jgi:hypothetical protein
MPTSTNTLRQLNQYQGGEDVFDRTKKQLQVEVINLRAEIKAQRTLLVDKESEYQELMSAYSSLVTTNQERFTSLLEQNERIVSRQLGLDKPAGEKTDQKPVGRRASWSTQANRFRMNERDKIAEQWTKKIDQVEAETGIMGKTTDQAPE